jgi:DNA-binding transcriptional ArsR family regulator
VAIDWGKLRLEDPGRRAPAPLTHAAGDPFIPGPLSREWLLRACRLPGSGLHVSILMLLIKHRRIRRREWNHASLAECLGVTVPTVRRALRAAVAAGVLTRGGSSRNYPVYGFPPGIQPRGKRRRDRLRGPLPWRWWYPALCLPGGAAQVAVALWLRQTETTSRRFLFGLADWDECGLSRRSVDRGLRALEGAGLVSVRRRRGHEPVVTLGSPAVGEP